MWSGKMAARWRGEDGDLNAGNSDFLGRSTTNELALSRVGGVEMDTQSCIDHSILAIFEDAAVSSEYKSGAEEESETLLSALTEMLDSVEDDDRTLSPFDTLPDTKLLAHPQGRDSSAEQSVADRLRPRSKSPNVTFTMKIDGANKDHSKMERNSPPQRSKRRSKNLFLGNKKEATEIEVFTSTSLVDLVKLMHPYCLKLHVGEEEDDELRRGHTLFSQEEVWKYERPREECDEEVNVVSDDEVTVKDTKEEEKRAESGANHVLLKSVLLNGNSSGAPPSREKKRVSFGPVQVAPFESTEKGLNERIVTTGHRSEAASVPPISIKVREGPADSALEPQTPSSETSSDPVAVLSLKGGTKAKSLSLQQYRQLRQKRNPLVEKQGNYTTMWPCVSEPPKELTPILCLQGTNGCGSKAAHRPPDGGSGADQPLISQTPGHVTRSVPAAPGRRPADPESSTHLRRRGLKRPSAGLQPDVTANPNETVPESKRSPLKKPSLLSSDPPNPVLLPLSVSRTTSPTDPSPSKPKVKFLNRDNLDSTRHLPGIQNESSGTFLPRQSFSSGHLPKVSLVNQCRTTLFQELKNRLSEIASGVSSAPAALCASSKQINAASEVKKLQPQKCSTIPTKEEEPKTSTGPTLCAPLPATADAPTPADGAGADVRPPGFPSERPTASLQSTATDSGIEALDLTSLLERFEETQAKEERVCENEAKSKLALLRSNLQTDDSLDRTIAAATQQTPAEALEPFSTSKPSGDPETLGWPPPLHMLKGAEIPEPLGTEIILRTRPDLPTRRRNPPPKAIQIIDPRPLPSRKSHTSPPAALLSPHAYSSVSSDHDYCGSADRPLTGASAPNGVCLTSGDLRGTTGSYGAAAECEKQTASSDEAAAQGRLSERLRTRSETSPSADVVRSDDASAEPPAVCAAEDETAPSAPPTPTPSPPCRSRGRNRYRRRSPCSDSSSPSSSSSSSCSSASPSPKRRKHHHKRSESSSCSSSSPSRSTSRSRRRRYAWSYSRSRTSRSRSRSWSQNRSSSRSRSPSPLVCRRQWTDVCSSRESRKLRREHEIRIQKLKAIDERRVVYVGRIRRSMTHNELRERFAQFGDVECVSLHFRDRGDHYAFVTFYNMDDAFAAIDNGGKLRKPDELPFDICFGGRRQFCNTHYADLDANRDAESAPAKRRSEDLDFDSLLKQAQRGLKS
ncbi:pprc1 [Pungitius sinensis]